MKEQTLSALALQREVLATKSTASMDFPFTAGAAVVATLWALYGAMVSDAYVLVRVQPFYSAHWLFPETAE
jgi:hypothetical protein